MTVKITPVDNHDANVIATVLEDGLCPWPGYWMESTAWPNPNIFILPDDVAAELMGRLYSTLPETGETVGVFPPMPPVAQPESIDRSDAADTPTASAEPVESPEPEKKKRSGK